MTIKIHVMILVFLMCLLKAQTNVQQLLALPILTVRQSSNLHVCLRYFFTHLNMQKSGVVVEGAGPNSQPNPIVRKTSADGPLSVGCLR